MAVIAALFLGVFVLRLLIASPAEPYSMFYVLPVALAATAFGLRGGLTSVAAALVLMVVSTVARHTIHTPAGWATRVVPIVLLGILLGRATDRAREVEEERRRLERSALLHREAIEINDALVQRMTAAKWALEAGQTEAGLLAITEAMSEAQRLVSGLIKRAQMGERSEALPVTTETQAEGTD